MAAPDLVPGYHPEITLPHEQAFELYHNALSLCSMKARLCMAELAIPYRSIHIDLIETGCYENVRPAYSRVHPGRTVPLLVHNGHPIYESHEQIRYAAQLSDAKNSLHPVDSALFEQMEHWIDKSSLVGDPVSQPALTAGNAIPGQTLPLFAAMIQDIPVGNILEGFLRHFDKRRPLLFLILKLVGLNALVKIPPLRQAVVSSRSYLVGHLDDLELQLQQSGGPWLLGPEFTLADVSWLVIFERLKQADALPVFVGEQLRPACHQYWQELQHRPSYAEAITAHQHPIVVAGTARIREAKQKSPQLKSVLEGSRDSAA